MDRLAQYAKGAINFVTSIFDIFVAFIVSVYVLAGRTEILQFFRRLIKSICGEKTFKNIEKYFNNTNDIFFGFISSQLIDAVVVGILTTIAMSIMQIKYAPLLGFIIGLFNIMTICWSYNCCCNSNSYNINYWRFFTSTLDGYSSNYITTN